MRDRAELRAEMAELFDMPLEWLEGESMGETLCEMDRRLYSDIKAWVEAAEPKIQ